MSREVILTKTAVDTGLPEDLVYDIISSAWEQTAIAFRTHTEIELSGFGTFIMSKNKTSKRIPFMKDLVTKLENDYNKEPTEENFKKKIAARESLDNLLIRYEKIAGIPFSSTEGSKTHR